MNNATASGYAEIVNIRGLDAIAAAKVVHMASSYACEITISSDGEVANAKEIMELLQLALSQGSSIEVQAIGADAESGVENILRLVAERFGYED